MHRLKDLRGDVTPIYAALADRIQAAFDTPYFLRQLGKTVGCAAHGAELAWVVQETLYRHTPPATAAPEKRVAV